MTRRLPHSEQGGATVELVLATPLLVVVLLLVVAFGRLATARADVDAAARAAARAASLQRSPAGAARAARAAAGAALGEREVTCRSLQVRTSAGAFRPGGTVTVEVACTVDLADLTLLRLPGSRTVRSRFAEPVDAFRGLTP